MRNFKNFIMKHKGKFVAMLVAVLFLSFGLFLDFAKPNSNGAAADETGNKVLSSAIHEGTEEKEETESKNTTSLETESKEPLKTEETTGEGTDVSVDTDFSQAPSTEQPKPEEKEPEQTKPEETVTEETKPEEQTNYCTISISCSTILNNMSSCEPGKVDIIPKDGWILKPTEVYFTEGETVFDVLERVCRENNIPVESSFNPMYNAAYIEGISNIYEFDVGQLSGWKYRVDGVFSNFGCSLYKLTNGQNIEWLYTCNMGDDL